jgi:hypothetical protein
MTRPADGAADHRREALLDQLRYLVLEIEALGPLLEELPLDLLAARPMAEPSILDAFARIAALDREVRIRQLEEMRRQDSPRLDAGEIDVRPAADAAAAVADVRTAREALVATFEALAPSDWRRTAVFPDGEAGTVYDLALGIVQDDHEVLRALTYRMHVAQFSFREGR